MPISRPPAAALALAGILALAARATAAPPPTAIVPPPGACVVEPRPHPEIAALLARPAATPAVSTPIPEGDFAPERTVAALEAALRGYLACVNADDPARALALLSDTAIARLDVAMPAGTPAATPVLGADVDLAEIVLTDGARQFADGRAGLYATLRLPGGAQPERWFFTFARVGDGADATWLIDDVAGTARFPLP